MLLLHVCARVPTDVTLDVKRLHAGRTGLQPVQTLFGVNNHTLESLSPTPYLNRQPPAHLAQPSKHYERPYHHPTLRRLRSHGNAFRCCLRVQYREGNAVQSHLRFEDFAQLGHAKPPCAGI